MELQPGAKVFVVVKKLGHAGGGGFGAVALPARVVQVQKAASEVFDDLVAVKLEASDINAPNSITNVVSECLVFHQQPSQEQMEEARAKLCQPHSYIVWEWILQGHTHHHRHGHHHHKRSSPSGSGNSEKEASPEGKRLHLDTEAVAVQAGNAVDLLRAKLHEACNEFYGAVHAGNMHGLEQASSAYADKCARLKDNVLLHLDDLNHKGMVELWLQQLKEPMTEFVAVAYDIHSPVNKQELRVKVERQAQAMSGGRMGPALMPQQQQLPRSEAAMPRPVSKRVCNLWDGQKCHFAECFPTKPRCTLETYHVQGVNTFDRAFYDRMKAKLVPAPLTKP